MTPEHEAERGEQARRLLEDALLNETLDAIDAKWITTWQNSPARDVEGRELAYQMWHASQLIRKELELLVDNGKSAQASLARRAGAMLKQSFGR